MSQKPTELELKILSVLWDDGELTVREVLEKIPDDRKRAYTTVLSTMQVMKEKKGLLDRREDGAAHVYFPLVQRDEVMKPVIGQMLSTVVGGKPSALLQCLLDDEEVDGDELTEIRRLIRQHADKNKKQKGE